MSESTCSHSILSWWIYFFKTPPVAKTKYFGQNTTCSLQFFKVVSHSICREKLRPVIHSLKRTGFFRRISLSHPFFYVGWFFLCRVSDFAIERMVVIHFLKDPVDTGRKLNVQGVFWTSYVRSIYVICLRRKLYLFWRENLQSSIVRVILSAVSNSMFSSKIAWFMHSFRGTIIISIGYLDPSVLSKTLYIFLTLKFAAIQFCQHAFFHRISGH